MGQCSNCAREFADAHIFGSLPETFNISLGFGKPDCQLKSESDRLGVNAVCAADHWGVLKFPSAAFQDFRKTIEVGGNNRRGLSDQQRLRRVNHVVGGQAIVKPACLRANDFRDRRRESDYVVTHFGFDFVDALQIKVGTLADGFGRVFWHHACLGKGFGGGYFHGEPGAEAIFIAPDAAHVRACVARNHGGVTSWFLQVASSPQIGVRAHVHSKSNRRTRDSKCWRSLCHFCEASVLRLEPAFDSGCRKGRETLMALCPETDYHLSARTGDARLMAV